MDLENNHFYDRNTKSGVKKPVSAPINIKRNPAMPKDPYTPEPYVKGRDQLASRSYEAMSLLTGNEWTQNQLAIERANRASMTPVAAPQPKTRESHARGNNANAPATYVAYTGHVEQSGAERVYTGQLAAAQQAAATATTEAERVRQNALEREANNRLQSQRFGVHTPYTPPVRQRRTKTITPSVTG